MVSNLEYSAGIGLSDHVVISYSINVTAQKGVSRYNYNKGDYDSMNSIMADTDWEAKLLMLSANEAWKHFSTSLNAAMTKCISKSVTKIWMTREATAKYRKSRKHGSNIRRPLPSTTWTMSEQLQKRTSLLCW